MQTIVATNFLSMLQGMIII